MDIVQSKHLPSRTGTSQSTCEFCGYNSNSESTKKNEVVILFTVSNYLESTYMHENTVTHAVFTKRPSEEIIVG